MEITAITVQDFRNIAFAELSFAGGQQFLMGANGQGKTNLLEAIGLITALRSFRTREPRPLLRWGARQAQVRVILQHEVEGELEVVIRLQLQGKSVLVDGERVTSLAALFGRFPTVTLSSQDSQLLRGMPAHRRRFLDLTLASMDVSYLQQLRRYHRALQERNRLLKQSTANARVLTAFEQQLAAAAAVVQRSRAEAVSELNTVLQSIYDMMSIGADEGPLIRYNPDLSWAEAQDYWQLLANYRARDALLKATQRGPHRDDFLFEIQKRPAKDFASEGQQRGLVIALRLAQAHYFQRHCGIRPILLADDVLGELDPERRQAFWRAVGEAYQVIASGVTSPVDDGQHWQVIQVDEGTFLGHAERLTVGDRR